ncbi:MAG TPA: hypothetical protein VLL52_10775 [Anaerolineae bacterium]|nr:hypothetical protein [Anaerolineae bacterium]
MKVYRNWLLLRLIASAILTLGLLILTLLSFLTWSLLYREWTFIHFYEATSAFDLRFYLYLAELIFISIITTIGFIIMPLYLVPDIVVDKDRFQLRLFWGLIPTAWLSFSQISTIIDLSPVSGPIYIGIKGSSWPLKIMGWLYRTTFAGDGLLLVTPYLHQYDDFVRLLRHKRPDLFKQRYGEYAGKT